MLWFSNIVHISSCVFAAVGVPLPSPERRHFRTLRFVLYTHILHPIRSEHYCFRPSFRAVSSRDKGYLQRRSLWCVSLLCIHFLSIWQTLNSSGKGRGRHWFVFVFLHCWSIVICRGDGVVLRSRCRRCNCFSSIYRRSKDHCFCFLRWWQASPFPDHSTTVFIWYQPKKNHWRELKSFQELYLITD